MITLQFPGMRPCAKARPRVANGHAYMPHKYQEWRHDFGWATCHQLDGTGYILPITDPSTVSVTYRTASGNMRPDVDNAAGAVLDALQDAGVIANDGQVRRLLVEVVKAKRADCGITVTIEAMP